MRLFKCTQVPGQLRIDHAERGNDYMLDEKVLHDTLSITKKTMAVIPGEKALKLALSTYLENFATLVS